MILVKLDFNYHLLFREVPSGLLEVLSKGQKVKVNGYGENRTIEPDASPEIQIEIIPDQINFNPDLMKLLEQERKENSRLRSKTYQLEKQALITNAE